MSPVSLYADELLTQLEAAKNRFDFGHASVIERLLLRLSRFEFADPEHLIRFHECLLFLRAFPHSRSHIPRVERLLNTFHIRIARVRNAGADMSIFDDFDTSGIAGTTMQDTLSFDVAQWLVGHIPSHVEIAWSDYWDDYESERARGAIWPRFIPLLQEDADVEANIPWGDWLDAARGRQKALVWLVERFEKLRLTDRQRGELYDSLRLPICWRLENLRLSRTRNWTRPRRVYMHKEPLIQRSEVSLAQELAKPSPKLEKLSKSAGESVMRGIREVMVVRYRELYGTTLGDPRSVVRADLGRGVVMHFWGLPPDRRLPLRAYLAGYTLKNGVPINYIEAIGLCEWIEVGFNTFYTYRQGETAWVYAQALRCLRALTDANCISIYPYQIGQNNEEAIDSGAFWFYRKLGFRPGRSDLQELCDKEERKIAGNRTYRTSRRMLKRLAEAHMFLDIGPKQPVMSSRIRYAADSGTRRENDSIERPAQRLKAGTYEASPWENFSTRNIGLLVNRRMAKEFHGDSQELHRASMGLTEQALGVDLSRWSVSERQAFENWSSFLALIPDVSHWSPNEKRALIELIRAKSSASEMKYLHLAQHHPLLRQELLRLGGRRSRT